MAAIPNNEAAWSAKYALFYGVQPPASCWENTDVNGVGTHAGFDDIDPFVKLIPTPCTPRACCFPDHTCQDLIPGQCLIAGGMFFPGPAGDKPCLLTTCP